MSADRPYTISIAGFDPCGGAGVLADIKTFESAGVQGMGVSTAITYQHEADFQGVDWLESAQVFRQLEVLLTKYRVRHFKIGLILSFEMLEQLVDYIRKEVSHAVIVWDPVLKSSTGFEFHKSMVEADRLRIDLITPNLEEIASLGSGNPFSIAQTLSYNYSVLLKGGHAEGHANDQLFEKGSLHLIEGKRMDDRSKHGSGCVLSSAITAYLAMGYSLKEACEHGKTYITRYLQSAEGLLGHHNVTEHA